jgi:hypothetical protein
MIENFLKNISNVEANYTLEDRKTIAIKEIKETV